MRQMCVIKMRKFKKLRLGIHRRYVTQFSFSDMCEIVGEFRDYKVRMHMKYQIVWIRVFFFPIVRFTLLLRFVHDEQNPLYTAQCMRNKHTFFPLSAGRKSPPLFMRTKMSFQLSSRKATSPEKELDWVHTTTRIEIKFTLFWLGTHFPFTICV